MLKFNIHTFEYSDNGEEEVEVHIYAFCYLPHLIQLIMLFMYCVQDRVCNEISGDFHRFCQILTLLYKSVYIKKRNRELESQKNSTYGHQHFQCSLELALNTNMTSGVEMGYSFKSICLPCLHILLHCKKYDLCF